MEQKLTHVIMTYSKIHYKITEEQAIEAASLQNNEERSIAGNLIRRANISDIVTMEKYYETFPNRRPTMSDMYKKLPTGGFETLVKNSPDRALRGFIAGLQRHINKTDTPEKSPSRLLLAKMQDKLKYGKEVENYPSNFNLKAVNI